MSFVLEALKKQEADRDPEAAVSLAKAGVLHRRHRRWVALFALAMAVNAALVGWLLWGGEPAAERPNAAATPLAARPGAAPERAAAGAPSPMWEQPGTGADAAAPARPAAAPPRDPNPAVARPAATTPVAPPPAQPAPAPAVPAAPARPRVIGLDDLTPAERARFPGIAFSTHIYSEDSELRAVVANGQRRQEGDRIRGLEILQITRDGVVLAFENKRVKVPLAVDWDAL